MSHSKNYTINLLQLLETAEKTTSDLQGLHEKVDRFREVEQHNTACEGAFSESFTGAVRDMIQQVSDFTSRQEDTISAHTEHIGQWVIRSYKHIGQWVTRALVSYRSVGNKGTCSI